MPSQNDIEKRLFRFFEGESRGRATNGGSGLAAGSVQGPHRQGNEDRAAVAEVRFARSKLQALRIAIVCDGMGGMDSGNIAASMAMASFFTAVICKRHLPLPELLRAAAHRANEAVFSHFEGHGGTTLSAVAISPESAWLVNIGDSRIYQVSADGDLLLKTVDDTIKGAINAHQGSVDEDDLDNRLLQFVGIGKELDPHLLDVTACDAKTWLVTSDGAHGIGRRALEDLVEQPLSSEELVRRFIYVADALNVRDNASVAAMQMRRDYESFPLASGVDLSLWSPTNNLNVWLFNDLSQEIDQPLDSAPAKSRRNLEKAAVKSVQKSRARSKISSASKAKDVEKPPMAVIFDQGPSIDD